MSVPTSPEPRERLRLQCEPETPSFDEKLAPFTSTRGGRPSQALPHAAAATPEEPVTGRLTHAQRHSAATDCRHARARQRSPNSAINAKPEHTREAIVTWRLTAFHGEVVAPHGAQRRARLPGLTSVKTPRTDRSRRRVSSVLDTVASSPLEAGTPVASAGLPRLERGRCFPMPTKTHRKPAARTDRLLARARVPFAT